MWYLFINQFKTFIGTTKRMNLIWAMFSSHEKPVITKTSSHLSALSSGYQVCLKSSIRPTSSKHCVGEDNSHNAVSNTDTNNTHWSSTLRCTGGGQEASTQHNTSLSTRQASPKPHVSPVLVSRKTLNCTSILFKFAIRGETESPQITFPPTVRSMSGEVRSLCKYGQLKQVQLVPARTLYSQYCLSLQYLVNLNE